MVHPCCSLVAEHLAPPADKQSTQIDLKSDDMSLHISAGGDIRGRAGSPLQSCPEALEGMQQGLSRFKHSGLLPCVVVGAVSKV